MGREYKSTLFISCIIKRIFFSGFGFLYGKSRCTGAVFCIAEYIVKKLSDIAVKKGGLFLFLPDKFCYEIILAEDLISYEPQP